tara:strand:+ start:59 stop:1288 length:1230 start_codon:yes stop_codon:yes gene_type:complete
MMIQELLNEHCLDPKNTYKLLKLAREYDRLEQGAMAVSLYLKTADISEDKEFQYECMIGIARAYQRQGNRQWTVKTAYQDAIALMPYRPEAHFFLAQFLETLQEWKPMLMHINLALEWYDNYHDEECILDIPGYGGYKGLLYYQALATWFIGGTQTGKHAFFNLKHRHDMGEYTEDTEKMLAQLWYPDTIPYKLEDYKRFKFYFDGLDVITENYSKHMQDLFVLALLNGKEEGSYLEIGSGDPFVHNNTALLETEFGWKGISIDNSEALCYNFKENRNNTIICTDATQMDYTNLFNLHCVEPVIDYLQIDCDEASMEILEKIPFETHKFGVITFEHDTYRLGTDIRDKARTLLKKHGYQLVVNDVAFSPQHSYEDWYVHPDVIDVPKKFTTNLKNINFVWDYFMNDIKD